MTEVIDPYFVTIFVGKHRLKSDTMKGRERYKKVFSKYLILLDTKFKITEVLDFVHHLV